MHLIGHWTMYVIVPYNVDGVFRKTVCLRNCFAEYFRAEYAAVSSNLNAHTAAWAWVLTIADKTSPYGIWHMDKRQCRHRASIRSKLNRFDANTDFVALKANDLRLDENMLVYSVFFFL